MDTFVFAAVLFAAACHAAWNATIKRGLDPLATTVLISIGAALIAAALVPVGRSAGCRRVAVVRRLGADPPVLFRGADRELSHRRPGAGLSDRARRGAADDRNRDDPADRRAARPAGLARHHPAGRRRSAALAARRPRPGAARSQGGRLRLVHRGHGLRLFGGRRHRRSPRRQRQRLYGRAVRRHRSGHGALCACARRPCGDHPDAASLGDRPGGRRAAARLLRHRDLGHDGGADRDRGGAARDQRAVRRR